MSTLIVLIVGLMVGNLCGMFLMALLMASRHRDDADRACRKYREGV